MATLDDEIKAAEKKMRQAYDALIEYLERPASQPADIKLHRRLADDLTLANAHYVTLVSKLRADWRDCCGKEIGSHHLEIMDDYRHAAAAKKKT